MSLRLALVRGPMYDHLYDIFGQSGLDVKIVVHEDHPTLNRRVAEMLGAGEPLDLISTHAKYAPSQAQWLRPLDDLVDGDVVSGLAPPAVSLCRVEGRTWCLPRLIDARVMWVRADRVEHAPDTWAELAAGQIVFGFPGRESGLFGTFFELVTGAGGLLFDENGRPTMDTAQAIDAVELLIRLAERAPQELVDWHYDEVDLALLDGRVDAAAAWPGAWGAISRSRLGDTLQPQPYPAGVQRRVSYAGCHAWAIPRSARDPDGALALLHLLLGAEAQAVDAAGGNICAHSAALAAVRPVDDRDRRRLTITRQTIDDAMITYPQLSRLPEIEEAGWRAINDALRHRLTATAAVARIQQVAHAALDSMEETEHHR
ncbi:MAG: extracellular solute-binding protein [Ilumatobacteraceae bacterium]